MAFGTGKTALTCGVGVRGIWPRSCRRNTREQVLFSLARAETPSRLFPNQAFGDIPVRRAKILSRLAFAKTDNLIKC